MSKIIVFGSLNMDMSIQSDGIPQKGETLNGYGFFTNAGGKGGNQAVAAAKLGAETHMIGKVGKDLFGQEILKTLSQYGVQHDRVGQSEKEATGVAMIICSEGDNRILLSAGANHEMNSEMVVEALEGLAQPGDLFLTQLECDFDTTMHALASAKKAGLMTILNPAPAKSLPDEVYTEIDLIVVNQTECEFLTGIYPDTEEDCRAAIAQFQMKGVKSVIITLGALGSVTAVGEEVRIIKSYKVDNVDTTAAGDAYIGALASSLLREESLIESMKLATMTAALTVTKRGAQQSIPYLNEVHQFFKEEKTDE